MCFYHSHLAKLVDFCIWPAKQTTANGSTFWRISKSIYVLLLIKFYSFLTKISLRPVDSVCDFGWWVINAEIGQPLQKIGRQFARHKRIVALIREQLQSRIDNLDMKLFLVENKDEFSEFVASQMAAQKAVETEIKSRSKVQTRPRRPVSFYIVTNFLKYLSFKQHVIRGAQTFEENDGQVA